MIPTPAVEVIPQKGKMRIRDYVKTKDPDVICTTLQEMYVDAEYVFTDEVKNYIRKHFQWELIHPIMDPICSIFQDLVSNPSVNLTDYSYWTLSVIPRYENTDLAQYSRRKIRMFSIRRSGVDDGGFGMFAEKTFQDGDIISVYMGCLKELNLHQNKRFNLRLDTQKMLSIPEPGNKKFLGAHKANDKYHKDSKTDERARNNALFEGIFLKARTKILIGKEITVSYDPANDPEPKKVVNTFPKHSKKKK